MTKHEATVITAYTGYLFVQVKDLLAYIKQKVGHTVYPEEVSRELFDSIHDAVLEDVLQLDFDGSGEPFAEVGDTP